MLRGRPGKMVQVQAAEDGRLVQLVARYPAERPEKFDTHFTRLTLERVAGQWQARLGFDPRHERFAVVHPSPRWRYKRWTDEGWRALVKHLQRRVAKVLITGAPDPGERRYLDGLALSGERVVRVDGQLRLAEVADLLRFATLYVGPDTAMTHLAAACGTPTLALFGPTDPVIWGPMGNGTERRPYQRVAPLQRRDRVLLVQNADLPCVPCQLEGCDRHRESRSDCLDQLPSSRVIEAADMLLGEQRTAQAPSQTGP